MKYTHHVGLVEVAGVALKGHGDEGVGVDVLAGDVQVTLARGAVRQVRRRGNDEDLIR